MVLAPFTLGGSTIGTEVLGTSDRGFVSGGAKESEVRAEGDVSSPARLLASSTLVYPSAPRKAEIEVDLPLEIIVDVPSAGVLARAGYDL